MEYYILTYEVLSKEERDTRELLVSGINKDIVEKKVDDFFKEFFGFETRKISDNEFISNFKRVKLKEIDLLSPKIYHLLKRAIFEI
jgi:hypothetical protein